MCRITRLGRIAVFGPVLINMRKDGAILTAIGAASSRLALALGGARDRALAEEGALLP